MSVTLSIKNKKSFLSYKVISVQTAVYEISTNITQFSHDENAANFNKKAFYESKISDHKSLILGIAGHSGRGFELSYDNALNEYKITIFTPSTRSDWQIALRYAKMLCAYLKSEISSTDANINGIDIENFSYENDIKNGLKNIASGNQIAYLSGVNRAVFIDAKMARGILGGVGAIDDFEKIFKDVQYCDDKFLEPMFFKDANDGVVGLYAITPDTNAILQHIPVDSQAQSFEATTWAIALVESEKTQKEESFNHIATLRYNSFFANLPKDRVEFLDSNYLRLQLSSDEMKALALKCKKL